MPLTFDAERRDDAIRALQSYADDHFDEPMGNIAAGGLLDFIIGEIGPALYNQGVADAQRYMQERAMELDLNVHEEEFPVTRRRKPSRRR
ncbi:MAG: DUF2164 domain-containing protein [Rhodothermales bacterium]